jgi:fructose-1,6-bisphosphatase I
MYPADLKSPSGKLRLLYEAGPIAYVFAIASGLASSGSQSIMSAQVNVFLLRRPLLQSTSEFGCLCVGALIQLSC